MSYYLRTLRKRALWRIRSGGLSTLRRVSRLDLEPRGSLPRGEGPGQLARSSDGQEGELLTVTRFPIGVGGLALG